MPLAPTELTALRETLLAGRYSLFLGAGSSRDSKDLAGEPLPLGEPLRQRLIKLKALKETSSLSRAYAQLDQHEIDEHLTRKFSGCVPGPTALKLTKFNWRVVYTLNIDDSLEQAYSKGGGAQSIEPLTHKAGFRNLADPTHLQVVHIHGWSKKPEDGYVFSLAEYAGSMGPGNPWVNVLAQTIASEPFIIAGTGLEEPDLEYFLTGRQAGTVRRDRGPSFLIEPNPDAGTIRDCERHGLTLYRGSLEQFLDELDVAFPSRPLPAGAVVGLTQSLFSSPQDPRELALFGRDFFHVAARQEQENADLGFYVGREPSYSDIALNRDVSRRLTTFLTSRVRTKFERKDWDRNVLLLDDNAGTGKTTILARSLYDLAGEGIQVFDYHSLSSPDITLGAKIFNALKYPFVIACDNFADHVSSIMELYRNIHRPDFLILATERSYRMPYVFQALGGISFERLNSVPFDANEAKELIVKMDGYGLTTSAYDRKKIDFLAKDLTSDSIALAVCRVMNDFRPVDRIIESLMAEADQARIMRYLACALASYCYKPGLSYSILSAAMEAMGLREQFEIRDILPLTFYDHTNRDYVIPANPVLGQRVLREAARTNEQLLSEIYSAVGAYVAPYVNRQTIIKRTPEARLAGRLFDYDEVVSQFLPTMNEKFFLDMKRYWSWNSRYWEQFALLKLDQFVKSKTKDKQGLLTQAVSHAKHAVKIERHPLPLTTLGKIYLEEMKVLQPRFQKAFDDAFACLSEAITLEGRMNRLAIHPYVTLFGGAMYYLDHGGRLDARKTEAIAKLMEMGERFFAYDSGLMIMLRSLRGKSGIPKGEN